MTSRTTTIAAQIRALPIDETARAEALHYVAVGEALADLFISVRDWLDASPSLKPSYQD